MGFSRFCLAVCCSLLFAKEIRGIIPLHQQEQFESLIAARDDTNWTPAGAPPLETGEDIFDWVDRVIDNGAAEKAKRDTAEDYVNPNPNLYYEKNTTHVCLRYNATMNYSDGPVEAQFERCMINPQCSTGVKPSTPIGPLVKADGTKIESPTFKNIIDEVYDISRQYSDPHSLNKAYSDLVMSNIDDLKNYNILCTNETDLPQSSPYGEIIHDELRKLLVDERRPRVQSVGPYYRFLFGRALFGGSVIAAVQVGLSQLGDASNAHGWEQWLNNAVGWFLFIIIGVESSRYAPELTGGPAILGLATVTWFKAAANKAKNVMNRVNTSAASLAGASISGGGQTGGNNNPQPNIPCVDPRAAEEGAINWGRMSTELVNMGSQAGFPLASQDSLASSSGQCRNN